MKVDISKYNEEHRFVTEIPVIDGRLSARDGNLYIFKFGSWSTNDNFYKDVRHYNAFFNGYRQSTGIQLNETDRRLFSAQRYDEYKFRAEMDATSKYSYIADYPDIIECKDIKDFFITIGFDYKKQKYNTGEGCRFSFYDDHGRIIKQGYKIPRKRGLTASA